ncbi:arc repressoR-sheeT [Caudoviricetes sp.]|nr:arc repressoR-sheeT [Caudoviricetes sp.]
MQDQNKTRTIAIDSATADKLRIAAIQQGVKMRQLVETILTKWLAKQ